MTSVFLLYITTISQFIFEFWAGPEPDPGHWMGPWAWQYPEERSRRLTCGIIWSDGVGGIHRVVPLSVPANTLTSLDLDWVLICLDRVDCIEHGILSCIVIADHLTRPTPATQGQGGSSTVRPIIPAPHWLYVHVDQEALILGHLESSECSGLLFWHKGNCLCSTSLTQLTLLTLPISNLYSGRHIAYCTISLKSKATIAMYCSCSEHEWSLLTVHIILILTQSVIIRDCTRAGHCVGSASETSLLSVVGAYTGTTVLPCLLHIRSDVVFELTIKGSNSINCRKQDQKSNRSDRQFPKF